MSVSLFNKDLSGWRVQATENLRFHVSDASVSGGYRHIHVPEGTMGTLTGEITIYYGGANEGACRALALDAPRLKKLLEHPELFASVRNAQHYWEAVMQLKGEELLAASISLNVLWDTLPKDGSVKGKCLAYVPWLKLVSGK